MSFLHQYLETIQAFTRIPARPGALSPADAGANLPLAHAIHFPGVGWVAGLLACTVFALLGLALPDSPYAPLAAAVGCTIATLWLTGAAHEKALARKADQLGIGKDANTGMIARPSGQAGLDGGLVLGLTLAGKLALLAVLAAQSPAAVLAALLAAQTISRFWPLLLPRHLPLMSASSTAPAHPLEVRMGHRALGLAALWCLPPLAIAAWAGGVPFTLLGVLLSGLALWGVQAFLRRRLKGYDGESLDASQQVCELAFYLGAAIGLGLG